MADRRFNVILNGGGNLGNFLRTTSNDIKSLTAQFETLETAMTSVAERSLNRNGGTPISLQPPGALLDDPTATILKSVQAYQSLGSTIKQVSTITKEYAGLTVSSQVTTFTGNIQKIEAAQRAYNIQLEAARGYEENQANSLSKLTARYEKLTAAQEASAVAANKAKEAAVAAQTAAQNERLRFDFAANGRPFISKENGGTGRPNLATDADYAAVQAKLTKAEADQVIATDAITASEQEIARLAKAELTSQKRINNATTRKVAALDLPSYSQAVRNEVLAPPSELPPSIAQLARYPDALRVLTGAGLGQSGAQYPSGQGPTNNEVLGNIYNVNDAADSIRITKDLRREVTTISGTFRNAKGEAQNFTLEVNKAGEVISRLGARTAGFGQILGQVGRDFQKVAEYAIATTAIFGAYQAIGNSVSTIVELDKSLQQFSITAGISRGQANDFFSTLKGVAYDTATPLKEIVKSADDVALAVSKPGQSVEELESKVKSLTTSVGILTNLTGIDTVKATDLLTSSYKQLGIEVEQVPDLLNKITAVAGGQSGAITDIIQAVASLGAAAKDGNLSIDELIGTVQTLSQVTSKTPAEVATSIKNLIGSLASPGSTKALEAFGIKLKDEVGNVKNILTVYNEIAQKIASGAIAGGQVQALVRAISGGPRRAPDASALLQNIQQVQVVTERSISATNEALIANAKILETASAKATQLKTAFDAFAFEKFGSAVTKSIENLSSILTPLFNILNGIPDIVYGIGGATVAIAVGFKVATSVIGLFTRSLIGTAENLGLIHPVAKITQERIIELANGVKLASGAEGVFSAESIEAANAATQLGNASQRAAAGVRTLSVAENAAGTAAVAAAEKQSISSRIAGKFSKTASLGNVLLPTAISGIASIGLDAAGGANVQEGIGNALTTLGAGALFGIPDPTGLTKIAGVIGIVSGLIVSLTANKGEDTKKTAEENAVLLDSLTTLRQAQDSVKGLTQQHNDLGTSIDELIGKENLDATEKTQLLSLQGQYAQSTLDLADANDTLAQSFDKVKDILPDWEAELAKAGKLNPEQLQQTIAKYSEALLIASNPNFKSPNDYKYAIPKFGLVPAEVGTVESPTPTNPFAARDFSITAIGGERYVDVQGQIEQQLQRQRELGAQLRAENPQGLQYLGATGDLKAQTTDNGELDLASLATKPEDVKKLFDAEGKNVTAYIDPSIESFGRIREAIKQIKDENLSKTFEEYASKIDAAAAISNQLEQNLAHISAEKDLGLISAEDADRLKGYNDLLKRVNVLASQRGGKEGAALFTDVSSKLFNSDGSPKTLNRQDAIDVGKEILGPEKVLDLEKHNALFNTVIGLLTRYKITLSGVSKEEIQAAQDSEDLIKTREDLDNAYKDNLITLTQRRASLQAALQGGEYKGNEGVYKAQVDQINALITANGSLKDSFSNSAEEISATKDGLQTVTGLEGVAGISTDHLSDFILKNAETFGLSGEQVSKYITLILHLIEISKQIPAATGELTNALDNLQKHPDDEAALNRYTTARTALQNLQQGVAQASNDVNTLLGQGAGTGAFAKSVQAAAETTKQAVDEITQYLDELEKAYQSVLSSIGSKQLDLAINIKTGNLDPQYAKDATQQLNSLQQGAEKLKEAFSNSGAGVQGFEDSLSGVAGLLGISDKSSSDLITTLIDLAEKYNLNSKEVDTFINSLIQLYAVQTALKALKDSSPNSTDPYKRFGDDTTAVQLGIAQAIANTEGSSKKILDDFLAALKAAKGIEDSMNGIKDFKAAKVNTFDNLIQKRNTQETDIRGLQYQRSQTTDPKEVAQINAQIAAQKEELAQTNALINANTALTSSFIKLGPAFTKTHGGAEELKDSLSKVHGLEFLVNVDTKDVIPALIEFAGQMGLDAKATDIFTTAIIEMARNLIAIDGFKSEITLQQNIVTKYTTIGEDPYVAGKQGAAALDSAYNPTATNNPDQAEIDRLTKENAKDREIINNLVKNSKGSAFGQVPSSSSGNENKLSYSIDELTDTIKQSEKVGNTSQPQDFKTIKAYTDKLYNQLPAEERKNMADNVITIFNGLNKVGTIYGRSSELVTKAMAELTDQLKKQLEFETKADAIRRIRIGSGDFAAIANVPFNSANNVSVGGPQGPITINMNINGQVLTPAQISRAGNLLAAQMKRSFAASSN